MASWSDVDVLKLIDNYKSHPVLWDPRHENHFKKSIKEDAWQEIGTVIGRHKDECKKKIMNLLGSYRREKSKEKRCRRINRNGTKEAYRSRWFAYEAFGFMSERHTTNISLDKILGASWNDFSSLKIFSQKKCKESGPNDNFMAPDQRTVKREADVDNEETQIQTLENGGENHMVIEIEEVRPKPPKRAKKKEQTSEDMMSTAFQLLEKAAAKFHANPAEDDEVTYFFKYVTTKVKNYPPETRKAVQQAVFEVLMKADRGFYGFTQEPVFRNCRQQQQQLPSSTQGGRQPTRATSSHACLCQPQTKQQKAAPTCSGVSPDDSTSPPVRSPSQHSNGSTSLDDLDDYV